MSRCDVIVAGAGMAGIAAATAAGRAGARTVLVESSDQIGGLATSALHSVICGLYPGGQAMPTDTLNPGIQHELADALMRAFPGSRITRMGRVYVLPYRAEDLISIARRMMSECGVELIMNSGIDAAPSDSGAIMHAGAGRMRIEAGAFIDCTGGAHLGALAGSVMVNDRLAGLSASPLAGYSVELDGIGEDELINVRLPYEMGRAVDAGVLPDTFRYTMFMPGFMRTRAVVKFSVMPEDEGAASEAEAAISWLRDHMPAFRDARIVRTSGRVMRREGARIEGGYTLTADDVIECRRFRADSVKAAWPIELWEPSRGPVYRHLPDGGHYEIPIGCVQSASISNLFMAGMCISATSEAMGSARVMGACLATGEMAGRAAAAHARK